GNSSEPSTLPPQRISAPCEAASSIQLATRSRSPSLINDDTSVWSSSGSPTFNASTCPTSASTNASCTSAWTYTRWVEMQDWPACEKPATDMAFAALAQSPSGSMITGALLPSSNPTFFLGALARMLHPTSAEPVNEIMAM